MEERDFNSLLSRKCKRKELRKTNKKLKVACRVAFSKHQKIEGVVENQFNDKKERKRAKRKRQAERKRQELLDKEDEPQDLEEFLKEAAEVRRQRMQEEVAGDDLEIQRLEKKISAQNEQDKKYKRTKSGDGEVGGPEEEFQADESDDFDFHDFDDMSGSLVDEEDEEQGSMGEESENNKDECQGSENNSSSGSLKHNADHTAENQQVHCPKFRTTILKLAKRAGMVDDVRQNVFCTIMSYPKPEDTFKEIQNLKLAGPKEREIIRVCVDCVLLEASFNPYYVLLIKKFCTFHKRFQVTTQYVLWDLIKKLESLKGYQQKNLSQMVAHLLKHQALGLSVLRIVDFADVRPTMSIFLKQIFQEFFLGSSDLVIRDAFLKVISSSKKKNPFSEGLQFYFEQPVAELLVGSGGDDASMIETFKKRLAIVKRLWSDI